MRWRGIQHTWERRVACKGLVRKPQGKKHFEDLDVDEMIILKWI
jgi:hypothetical protein